jgi:hypothetical protein
MITKTLGSFCRVKAFAIMEQGAGAGLEQAGWPAGPAVTVARAGARGGG